MAGEALSRFAAWGRDRFASKPESAPSVDAAELREPAAAQAQAQAPAKSQAPVQALSQAETEPKPEEQPRAFPRLAGRETDADATRTGPVASSGDAAAPASPWTLRDRLADWSERFTGRFGEVWWVGSGEPITLSLPRGATVLVVTGVVAIIVMAFAAGRRSGPSPSLAFEPALARADTAVQVASRPPNALVDGVPGGSESLGTIEAGGALPVNADRLQARFDAGMDPRVDGLNYLVYMTATRRECLRLADFLNEHDVQAIVMRSSRSVHSAGPDGESIELPLYWVVDVGEGFSRNQYLRGEHEEFRAERMELGRAWKRYNGDRGSDLSDMQFYAYRASAR